MAITSCTISGNIKTPDNQALEDVTVKAYPTRPFTHADGTLIAAYQVSTTTDSSGDWALTLVETATVSKTLTIVIEYPTGGTEFRRQEYTVTVPNQASANFSDLITGQ